MEGPGPAGTGLVHHGAICRSGLSGADALLDPLASSLSAFPRYQNERCSTGSVWCAVRVCGGVLECADVAHE